MISSHEFAQRREEEADRQSDNDSVTTNTDLVLLWDIIKVSPIKIILIISIGKIQKVWRRRSQENHWGRSGSKRRSKCISNVCHTFYRSCETSTITFIPYFLKYSKPNQLPEQNRKFRKILRKILAFSVQEATPNSFLKSYPFLLKTYKKRQLTRVLMKTHWFQNTTILISVYSST